MKISINTPNTLLLGIYTQSGKTAALGKLTTIDGTEDGVIDECAEAESHQLLARVLEDAHLIEADYLYVFTNDQPLAEAFTVPVRIPQIENDWFRVARRLIADYRRWRFLYTDQLPKVKERWQQQP